MNNGREAFVITDRRSSYLTVSSANESGKNWRTKPSDKLIDHQLQCRKERENGKRSELKDTSFEAQEFAFNECSGTGDLLPVHGVRK